MPRKSINTSLPKDFEPRRKNPISLGKDSNIDNDSKSLKIGEEHTGIEFATDSVLFTKDVIIAGESTIKDVSITNLEVDGTITLDTSESLAVHINTGDSKIAKISSVANQGSLYLYSVLDSNDYSLLTTAADGATTFNSTNNSDSTLAHLTLQPGGDLKLDPVTQNIIINATDKLYIDGGNNTYFKEQSDDTVRLIVGGQVLFQFKEDATTSVAQSSSFLTACPVVMKDIGGVPDTPSSGYGSLYINGDSPYVKTDGGLAHPIFTGWHGSVTRIKIFPHQFVEHEGTAGRQHALVEDDVSGKLGVRVSNTSAVLFTWVAIPTGYTATVVRCYADTGSNLDVQCYSTDIDDGDITDIGSGDASAEVNITDVASTTTNSIIVMLTFANTTTEFY